MTPGKVYGLSNFQKFAPIKNLFLKILKIHEKFSLFLFYLPCTQKGHVHNGNEYIYIYLEDGKYIFKHLKCIFKLKTSNLSIMDEPI